MSKKKKTANDLGFVLTPKPSQKNSEIIGISLWPPSNPDLNFFITLYGEFYIPIQILVCLRIPLRMNGIKCLKNSF